MKKNLNKSLVTIIDELAKEKGYPHVKLSANDYKEVLRTAHEIKFGTDKSK